MMMDNLEEPQFQMEKELIIMTKDEKSFSKIEVDDSLKANILLLSYNRPRMLAEAVESVLSQSYTNFDLYIVDDGSDFDVWQDIVAKFNDNRILLYQASKISLEERVRQSRLGLNLNNVIRTLKNEDAVFYLCDDDILAPEWLGRAMTGFSAYPDQHVVAAESWWFNEGEDWKVQAKYGMDIPDSSQIETAYWSTGSFAHRALCCKVEGLYWKDNKHLHSQDCNFILDLWDLHHDYLYIPTPAIYRREHENTLSAKLGRKGLDGRYTVGFIPPPATAEMMGGPLE